MHSYFVYQALNIIFCVVITTGTRPQLIQNVLWITLMCMQHGVFTTMILVHQKPPRTWFHLLRKIKYFHTLFYSCWSLGPSCSKNHHEIGVRWIFMTLAWVHPHKKCPKLEKNKSEDCLASPACLLQIQLATSMSYGLFSLSVFNIFVRFYDRAEPAVSQIMNQLGLRNNRSKFIKTAGKPPIILEEFIEYNTPI